MSVAQITFAFPNESWFRAMHLLSTLFQFQKLSRTTLVAPLGQLDFFLSFFLEFTIELLSPQHFAQANTALIQSLCLALQC